MLVDLSGVWKLVAWRRISEDGTVTYPLGDDAHGQLIYTKTGRLAVQMTAANRPQVDTSDALGGDEQQRAEAYSTCLAYFGSYEVCGETVVHRIDESLFPNWSDAEQTRPFDYDGEQLVLRTPPTQTPTGTVVNAIAWVRDNR
jgi:hypothetical protein